MWFSGLYLVDILGVSGKGIHSIRFLDIAIIDVLLTIIVAYVISLFIKKNVFFLVLLSLFCLGIILHRLFCVRTKIDKLLFS